MSELEYGSSYASDLALAGITPAANPINFRGVIKALCSAIGGVNGTAVTVTTPTLGAAAQLAQTSNRASILLDVTAGGNLVIAIGPTSGVANTVFSGTAVVGLFTLPLPPGWFIAVTTSNTATWSATVLNGI